MILGFSMKGVLLFCLMSVHVDNKTSNFFHLVFDNSDFLSAMVHEN